MLFLGSSINVCGISLVFSTPNCQSATEDGIVLESFWNCELIAQVIMVTKFA